MAEFDLRYFDGVALDFDGTMSNSNGVHIVSRMVAYEQMAAVYSDPRFLDISQELHDNAHLLSRGSHSEDINAWLLAEVGIIPDTQELDHPVVVEVCARIKEHYHEVVSSGLEEQPGASQFVRMASVRKPGKLAIGSTAERLAVVPYLVRHGLIKYFPPQRLILANHPRVASKKPAPDVYEVAADIMGVSIPERLLVIEDSEPGVEAGKRMGATVVALEHTRSAEALLAVEPAFRPDKVVPDMTALSDLVGLRKSLRQ